MRIFGRRVGSPIVLGLAIALLWGCAAGHRRAGVGDVAFRLNWDGISDLDLMVVEPGGECLSYLTPGSGQGGRLDVDCNAGTESMCRHPVENVFWPEGTAPEGRYRFWVVVRSFFPEVPEEETEPALPFTVRVLDGTRTHWSYTGSVREKEEIRGPFQFDFPGGRVTGDGERDSWPGACTLPDALEWLRGRFDDESGSSSSHPGDRQ